MNKRIETQAAKMDVDINKVPRIKSTKELRNIDRELSSKNMNDKDRLIKEIQVLRGVRSTNIQKSKNSNYAQMQKVSRKANRGTKGRSKKR